MSHLPGMPMIGQHDQAAPTTTPTGLFPLGLANAAPAAVTEGDACAPSLTLARQVRVAAGTPGAGRTALHVLFVDSSLAGGTSTVTIHTAAAGVYTVITSVVARYIGTAAGVTLQLDAAGAGEADVLAEFLISGRDVNLLGPGRVIYLTAAELLQVIVTGATATNDLQVRIHGEELAI